MALYLEQTLYNGDVVRYHRIGEYRFKDGVCTVLLHSFRDSKHRGLPVAPVHVREYSFALAPGGYMAQAYAAIKALPEWANAVDV